MQKIITVILSCLIAIPVIADNTPLNLINLKITHQGWVQASMPKVTVQLNATLEADKLAVLRNAIPSNLSQIASISWHIISFQQDTDNSGFLKVTATATAHVPSDQIRGLNAKATKVSTTGQKYKITSIDYQPSLRDIQRTQGSLRDAIYTSARDELTLLNKIYPTAHYFLHGVTFQSQPLPARLYRGMAMMRAAASPQASSGHGDAGGDRSTSSQRVAVSQELTLTANVILASRVK